MSEQPAKRPAWWRGCFVRVLIAVAALVALFFAIGLAFDQGPDSIDRASADFNAGVAEEYARGDVTYIEPQHVFVVRLDDGSFVALYDKSPKQQEIDSNCRVRYDERAQLGGLAQLPGFQGAFVEECEGTRAVWRADGERAFGAGYGNLDRFRTRVDGADLIIEMDERTCTRSRGVPGVPPFDVTTCDHP